MPVSSKKNGGCGRRPPASAVLTGTAASSAQLAASTRARTDPKRVMGTANAVAAGLDLTRVGVLSDRELDWIRSLAYGEAIASDVDAARAAEEARRKALSTARMMRWGDTPEARQEAFLRARQAEADEAERRRTTLDELSAQEREEARLARVAAAELARLHEDPRGRNAKSILMLHEAIRDREQQIAFQRSVKEAEAQASAQERNAMLMEQWGYTAEELQKRLSARERDMAEKNYNLEMVLFQLQERLKARAEDKEEGVLAQAAAREEARENAAELTERRQRELDTTAYNASCARPAMTRLEKLRAKVEEGAAFDCERARQESMEQRRTAEVTAAQQQRQARFEERKRAGLERHAVEASPSMDPKHRTQDRFAQKGASFLDRMAAEDEERVQRARQTRRAHGQEERETVMATAGPVPAWAAGTASASAYPSGSVNIGGESDTAARKRYERAEATASGFTSLAEEKAYLAEMRALPGTVREEAARREAERLAEALRVEEIQKMQAAEKRERERREAEAARDGTRQQRTQQQGDDERFRAYIEAQLPQDLHPVLRAKALQLE